MRYNSLIKKANKDIHDVCTLVGSLLNVLETQRGREMGQLEEVRLLCEAPFSAFSHPPSSSLAFFEDERRVCPGAGLGVWLSFLAVG